MPQRRGHGAGAKQSAGTGAGGNAQHSCCGMRRHVGATGRGALAEPALLGALLRQSGHGYDLRKAIEDITDGSVQVDTGGLYRVLRRLEDEGFVTSAWVEGESGPQRRTYELTPQAHELAEDWVVHLRERERLAGILAVNLEDVLGEASSASSGSTIDTQLETDIQTTKE